MRVLISGAGIAGPTLAFWLAKCGAQVTVLEKDKALLSQGQNIDLEGGAVTIMKKMGVFDDIRRLNTTEKGTQFIDSSGKPCAKFHVEGISPTSEYEILRGDLAITLYEATKDLANVTYRFGTTISNVVSNDEKSVKVELNNGETETYDILAAADGQWSRVRKQVFPADTLTIVDKDMYCAYFTIPREPEDVDWWTIYHALNSRVISTRPDSHGAFHACLSMMPCDSANRAEWQAVARSDRQAQEDLTRRTFADAGWQAKRIVDAMPQAPDFYLQALQQIRLSTWAYGRVVCIGDAAYAPTPIGGNGTSMAIMGAYLLAGQLSELDEGEHPRAAFVAYEKLFRPHVEKSQDIPSFIPGIAHPKTAWGRWTLHTVMAIMAKIAAIPWVVRRCKDEDPERMDSGLRMPAYAAFDAEVVSKSN